jgi:hypothetical protein
VKRDVPMINFSIFDIVFIKILNSIFICKKVNHFKNLKKIFDIELARKRCTENVFSLKKLKNLITSNNLI